MEIAKLNSNPGLLDKLAENCFRYLNDDRGSRWSLVLKSGKGIEKLSVFEFLDPKRRANKLSVSEIKGWPQLQAQTDAYSNLEFYGLYWDSRRCPWEITGVFRELMAWLEAKRPDCWINLRSGDTTFIVTHERDFVIMEPPRRSEAR